RQGLHPKTPLLTQRGFFFSAMGAFRPTVDIYRDGPGGGRVGSQTTMCMDAQVVRPQDAEEHPLPITVIGTVTHGP
ncbi:hypothetical protein, partial [Stenotrophomonas sp. 22385]|uniref:hypothetical protein n=1 Tax=Stenotrophomonas sp. 22385 TaxID=3453915 RepID=UPI003F8266F6